MKIIGFNLTKVNLEKKSNNLKNLKVSTSIDVLEVKEVKSNLFTSSEKLIGITFEYIINYEKDIAVLRFQGNLVIATEPKQAKEVFDNWEDKKLPEEFRTSIFNIIFKKSSLKALQFEDEFNLPSHIPLPSFKPKSEKK